MHPTLRTLEFDMVKHIKSATHLKKYTEKNEEAEHMKKKAEKNLALGRKIGSLAYFIFYNKLSFLLFENFLSWLSLNQIDIGQINHSEKFLRRLIEPCHKELLKRLQRHLNAELPCTGQVRPINIMADKGTVKHDCKQITMIRTLAIQNGCLFERFFLDHPEVLCHKGEDISNLLLQSCCEKLNLSIEDLRLRFTGACFDGQYVHLNVRDHFAEKMHLPLLFMEDSVIHDCAHRLELAVNDAKNGKKDRDEKWVKPQCKWLLELDRTLQHIMTKFNLGANHSDLRNIAIELKETFLEFCMFSDTRWIEYAYRTYDHFERMLPILYDKIKRDESKAEKQKDADALENLESLLVQVKTVSDLLFMRDVSHLLTVC